MFLNMYDIIMEKRNDIIFIWKFFLYDPLNKTIE